MLVNSSPSLPIQICQGCSSRRNNVKDSSRGRDCRNTDRGRDGPKHRDKDRGKERDRDGMPLRLVCSDAFPVQEKYVPVGLVDVGIHAHQKDLKCLHSGTGLLLSAR